MKINKLANSSSLYIYIGLGVLIMSSILQIFITHYFTFETNFNDDTMKLSIFSSTFIPFIQYIASFFLILMLLQKGGILPITIKNKKVQRVFVGASSIIILICIYFLYQIFSCDIPVSIREFGMDYSIFALYKYVYTMPLIQAISLTGIHLLYGCLIGSIFAFACFEPSVRRKKDWIKDSDILCIVFASVLLVGIFLFHCYFSRPNQNNFAPSPDTIVFIRFISFVLPVFAYILSFYIIGMLLFYAKALPTPLKNRKLQWCFLIIALLVLFAFLYNFYLPFSYNYSFGNQIGTSTFFNNIFYPVSLVELLGTEVLTLLWRIVIGIFLILGCHRPPVMISREEYYRRPIE